MEQKLLELHFAQLERAWAFSLNNKYSDKFKQEHFNSLNQVFEIISKDVTNGKISDVKISFYKAIIDLLFKNIDYLDKSTLNLIPFEITKCLEIALKEWSKIDEKIVILTKESNTFQDYYFDTALLDNKTYKTALFSITSNKITFDGMKYILISFPRYLRNDYLYSVALYHELGHYIDYKYKVSFSVYDTLKSKILNDALTEEEFIFLKKRIKFFSILDDLAEIKKQFQENKTSRIPAVLVPIQEYFADIFASQYVDDSLTDFISYISEHNDDDDTSNYPTYENRGNTINEFLKGKQNYFLKSFNEILELNTLTTIGRKEILKKRCKSISKKDFESLLPTVIDTEAQLHYLFKIGWDIWKSDWKQITKQNNIKFNLSIKQKHHIVNNLIEKSISNFIVTKNWDKIK